MGGRLAIAQEMALDAIRDQAHDLMGCLERLEEWAEANKLSDADHEKAAQELSEELYRIADWLEAKFTAGEVRV